MDPKLLQTTISAYMVHKFCLLLSTQNICEGVSIILTTCYA
jgi:hypothetical protein